jgi:hypothetical protein
MKKITLLLILALVTVTLTFAQSKKEHITKKWKVIGLEEFGTKYEIKEDRKGDWLEFKNDGTFIGAIYKEHVEGKWSANGSKVVITASKSASKTKINWIKSIIVEKEKLIFTYQDGDLIQATLTFSPF